MPALTCNACNKEFADDAEQKLHYRSEWHRYNLKRKVAGVPGVTEALFLARLSALSEEKDKLSATPMTYSCTICGKEYRSSKAHTQHLNSRIHIMRASQETGPSVGMTVIKPTAVRQNRHPGTIRTQRIKEEDEETEESEGEWEEMDPNEMEDVSESVDDMKVDNSLDQDDKDEDMDEDMDEYEDLDPTCCFMCDLNHDSIESCMVHMHKQHGFFIPDIEYLKDPKGFLTYVGLKVKRDFVCLYCNDRCLPFQSLEAVRKHMTAKGHCKVHYGDGGDDEEVELEEFYDYSSSYVDDKGKQLTVSDSLDNGIELGSGGSELVITKKSEQGVSVKALGSREFLRYYRQKPRPSPARDVTLAISLASRYRSMGLATIQSKAQVVRMKVLREMNRTGVEAMRSKIGMKSNVIRNLPKNIPY